jgi:hypothetical protein
MPFGNYGCNDFIEFVFNGIGLSVIRIRGKKKIESL